MRKTRVRVLTKMFFQRKWKLAIKMFSALNNKERRKNKESRMRLKITPVWTQD